jgi:hypothetical protein
VDLTTSRKVQRIDRGEPEIRRPDSETTLAIFNRAKAKREINRMEREELDLKQRKGELLDRGEVSAAWHGQIAAAKSRLLSIGDELGDKLAAEIDPTRCRAMVDGLVYEALENLSEYPANA